MQVHYQCTMLSSLVKGPAGLSAASALGRVRSSALLTDSGVYHKDHPGFLTVYHTLTKSL